MRASASAGTVRSYVASKKYHPKITMMCCVKFRVVAANALSLCLEHVPYIVCCLRKPADP